jgi:ATPase subunit of ABC transporter with duplicated ATPase domains
LVLVAEAPRFTLANPGGGQPLLENASLTLVRGRRYGLIGRNGKGKSTLLRALACRRVGEVPSNVTVHYVSQEVRGEGSGRREGTRQGGARGRGQEGEHEVKGGNASRAAELGS